MLAREFDTFDNNNNIRLIQFFRNEQLIVALQNRDMEGVNRCLENGADPNAEHVQSVNGLDKKGSALHVAAALNLFQAIDALVDKGAELSTKNSDGMTPLLVTATAGFEEFVDKLLEREVLATTVCFSFSGNLNYLYFSTTWPSKQAKELLPRPSFFNCPTENKF